MDATVEACLRARERKVDVRFSGENMYGLVNAAFRELVITTHGVDVWEAIRAKSGVQEQHFSKMGAYPDALTYQMVAAGAELLGVSGDELLISFGKFWITYTIREGYEAMFEIAGPSLPDFLLSLDELHVRVGENFPKLKPPSFKFDLIDRSTMRMHYLTSREGLCSFVHGLLVGLSERFQTRLDVEQVECRARGAEHCVFMLKLGESTHANPRASEERQQS